MIIDEICLENPCQQLCFSVLLPTELSQSYFPRFPIRPRCPYFFRLAPSQRSSPQAISHGFPSLPSRSFPTELSPSYFFPRFPVRPPCRRFHLAPSQPSSPQAISHGFPSVHDVHTSSVSLPPNGALPKLFCTVSPPSATSISLLFPTVSVLSTLPSLPSRSFPTELSRFFPLRPPCRRFHLAPSPRSSPQAISHGCPSNHPVVASISLLPNGALPKLCVDTLWAYLRNFESWNKVGQRTRKQDGTQHAFFWTCCGVGSCALDEIDVRSSLKHRAQWWYQGPQFTTACCVSYVYILLVAIAANAINFIPSF